MKQEILNRWINVLENTEKKQGSYRLKRLNTNTKEYNYCCLGILCEDVFELKSEKTPISLGEDPLNDLLAESFEGSDQFLPASYAFGSDINIRPCISISSKNYQKGLNESELFKSAIEKINLYTLNLLDSHTVETKIKDNQYFSIFITELNDKCKLTFKEIAALLKYADNVT